MPRRNLSSGYYVKDASRMPPDSINYTYIGFSVFCKHTRRCFLEAPSVTKFWLRAIINIESTALPSEIKWWASFWNIPYLSEILGRIYKIYIGVFVLIRKKIQHRELKVRKEDDREGMSKLLLSLWRAPNLWINECDVQGDSMVALRGNNCIAGTT